MADNVDVQQEIDNKMVLKRGKKYNLLELQRHNAEITKKCSSRMDLDNKIITEA